MNPMTISGWACDLQQIPQQDFPIRIAEGSRAKGDLQTTYEHAESLIRIESLHDGLRRRCRSSAS